MSPHKTGGTNLCPLLLAKLSEFVETRLGLHFPPAQLADLERGVRAAAGELGCKTDDSCLEWLLSSTLSPEHIKILASHLTIGETYFFRDKRIFEILETQILPEIFNSRRGREQNLRIWSAACSSGEEPYSLAILLTRLLADLQNWHIDILATDISPVALKKASEGIYREWSFRDTPTWIKERCFQKIDSKFQIAPQIRRMVTFSSLNLAEDPYPAIINTTNAMDIIFCRNVLMYFSRERAHAVIHNLARCLVEGGWLIIGPVEIQGTALPSLLHPVQFPGAVLYRRATRPAEENLPAMATPAAALAPQKPAIATTTRTAPPAGHTIRHNRVPTPPAPPGTGIDKKANQARLLADQGKLAEALLMCEEEIQSDKLNPARHYLQATILQEMGRLTDAATALQRALYINQDFAIAHFALGLLQQRRGKQKQALKHLKRARSLLQMLGEDDIPPEAEGMTAGRLVKLITAMESIDDGRLLNDPEAD